jgi:glutaredoxin
MIKLYQAEWCPFSHRIRAKLTELGIRYEVARSAGLEPATF